MKIEWKIDNEYRNKSLSNAKRHRISLHTSTYKMNERRKKKYETGTQFSLCSVCVCVLRIFLLALCWYLDKLFIPLVSCMACPNHASKSVPTPSPHREKKSKERDEVRLAF